MKIVVTLPEPHENKFFHFAFCFCWRLQEFPINLLFFDLSAFYLFEQQTPDSCPRVVFSVGLITRESVLQWLQQRTAFTKLHRATWFHQIAFTLVFEQKREAARLKALLYLSARCNGDNNYLERQA
jgi:hypothetical protein